MHISNQFGGRHDRVNLGIFVVIWNCENGQCDYQCCSRKVVCNHKTLSLCYSKKNDLLSLAEFTYSDHGSDKIEKDMEYLRDYYPLINGETTAKKCNEKSRSQQINILTEETEIDNDEEVRTITYTNRQNLNNNVKIKFEVYTGAWYLGLHQTYNIGLFNKIFNGLSIFF